MPIVNLLDSYKVYHKVGPPPICGRVSWNWLLLSCFLRRSAPPGIHALTHTSRVPFMHSSASPITTLPLSPSVVGLLPQMSTFRPVFCFFPGNSYVFGILIFSVTCLRLFVRKHRPQILLRKSWKGPTLPPLPLKKRKAIFSHPSGLWWIKLWVFSVIRVWKCVLPV